MKSPLATYTALAFLAVSPLLGVAATPPPSDDDLTSFKFSCPGVDGPQSWMHMANSACLVVPNRTYELGAIEMFPDAKHKWDRVGSTSNANLYFDKATAAKQQQSVTVWSKMVYDGPQEPEFRSRPFQVRIAQYDYDCAAETYDVSATVLYAADGSLAGPLPPSWPGAHFPPNDVRETYLKSLCQAAAQLTGSHK